MKLDDAIKNIFKEAMDQPLGENQSSDPVVDETAGAIVNALVMALDEDPVIGDNAFEMMMGSAPDENRLTQVRLEDVEATSELVVQSVYRDPELHAKLKQIAMDMIESASEATRG